MTDPQSLTTTNNWRKKFMHVAGLVALFAFGAGETAGAQNCSTSCSMYVQGQCTEFTQTCTEEIAVPHYGAIAYGRKSGAYGYSHRWNSRKKAESIAMQNCAKHGSDCEVMLWFDRKCGAVAARSDSPAAYWGLGNSDGEARAEAMRQCAKDEGQQCRVKVSQCSK